MAKRKSAEPEDAEVRVSDQLTVVKNNRRAADLFGRILWAIEYEEELERKRRDNDNGGANIET
jgi:hypothetical protein